MELSFFSPNDCANHILTGLDQSTDTHTKTEQPQKPSSRPHRPPVSAFSDTKALVRAGLRPYVEVVAHGTREPLDLLLLLRRIDVDGS